MDVTDKIRPWMKECRLCPRNCGADRMAGQKGFCGTDTEIMVARAALHMWEDAHAFPGKRDQELYFFPDVRWDAISVRTEEYPGARGERRLHRNTW
mgnify:FL=1